VRAASGWAAGWGAGLLRQERKRSRKVGAPILAGIRQCTLEKEYKGRAVLLQTAALARPPPEVLSENTEIMGHFRRPKYTNHRTRVLIPREHRSSRNARRLTCFPHFLNNPFVFAVQSRLPECGAACASDEFARDARRGGRRQALAVERTSPPCRRRRRASRRAS
jgi:hypothetical protein